MGMVPSEPVGSMDHFRRVRTWSSAISMGGWPNLTSKSLFRGAPLKLRLGGSFRLSQHEPKLSATYLNIPFASVTDSQIGTRSPAPPLFSCSHPPTAITCQHIGYL